MGSYYYMPEKEKIEVIVDILMNAGAVTQDEWVKETREKSKILYDVPFGCTVSIDFEKLARALLTAYESSFARRHR